MLSGKSSALILTLLFLNIILAGILYNQIKDYREKEKEAEEKAIKLEDLSKYQKEDVQAKSAAYYEMQIKKLLSEPELVFLAQKQWAYAVTINGSVLKQSINYIKEDFARIILSEMILDNEILPKEILKKGTITGNDVNNPLQENLSILASIPYTTVVEENDQGRRVIYDFKRIPEGTIISLKMKPILAERLKIGKEAQQWETRVEIIRK